MTRALETFFILPFCIIINRLGAVLCNIHKLYRIHIRSPNQTKLNQIKSNNKKKNPIQKSNCKETNEKILSTLCMRSQIKRERQRAIKVIYVWNAHNML